MPAGNSIREYLAICDVGNCWQMRRRKCLLLWAVAVVLVAWGISPVEHYEEDSAINCRRHGHLSFCANRRYVGILCGAGRNDQEMHDVDKKPAGTTPVVDNGVFKTRAESRDRHEYDEGLYGN
jgi:hypothetical protein